MSVDEQKDKSNKAEKKRLNVISSLLLIALGAGIAYFTPILAPELLHVQDPYPKQIKLGSFIRLVEAELRDSERQLALSGQKPVFKTKELELEVSFVVGSETDAGVKTGPELFAIESKAQQSNEQTHKLILHLEPLGDEDSPSGVRRAALRSTGVGQRR